MTKRHRIEQAEETKRVKVKTRGDGWLFPWFLVAVGVIAVSIVVGISYNSWLDAKYLKSGGCFETAEIISVSTSARMCPVGGWYESKPVDGHPGEVLVRCHCGPVVKE